MPEASGEMACAVDAGRGHSQSPTYGYRIRAGNGTIVWAPRFPHFPWARDADLMFAEGAGWAPPNPVRRRCRGTPEAQDPSREWRDAQVSGAWCSAHMGAPTLVGRPAAVRRIRGGRVARPSFEEGVCSRALVAGQFRERSSIPASLVTDERSAIATPVASRCRRRRGDWRDAERSAGHDVVPLELVVRAHRMRRTSPVQRRVWTRLLVSLSLEVPLGVQAEGAAGGRLASPGPRPVDPSPRRSSAPFGRIRRRAFRLVGRQALLRVSQKPHRERVSNPPRIAQRFPQRGGGLRCLAQARPKGLVGHVEVDPRHPGRCSRPHLPRVIISERTPATLRPWTRMSFGQQ